MKKGLTELVMILDRSGSMCGLEADTIGGFNSMIERQRKEEGEAYVSVVLFDDQIEVIYDRVDIQKIEPMTDNQYYVRGCTALLDAVGGAIHHIGNIHKYAREEDRPEKTLFVITTDGMENASRRYTYDKVRRRIERQKEKYGWEFIFLGANIDAAREAARFGISASRAARYEHDCEGTALNYSVVSDAVSKFRTSEYAKASAVFDDEDVLAPIREDFKRRHKRNA
ncbi:MAG: VWA domain-containing protein [Mogibacterium sp.]|nr:VWA domain-containing protein [Mogibacterium sp.]